MFNTVFLLSLSAVLTVPSSSCLSVSGGIAVKGFYHDADSNPIGLDSSGYATSDWVNQVFARVVNTLTTQINHNLDSSNSNSIKIYGIIGFIIVLGLMAGFQVYTRRKFKGKREKLELEIRRPRGENNALENENGV